jgi:hypothetical protein
VLSKGKDKKGVSRMSFYKISSIFALLYYHYLASIDKMNDELKVI